MAKEQDVFQLPVRYIDYENIEEMALAVQRNFKELERQLAILQLAVKKATGGGIKDLPYKASIWDRADVINEDGTIPARLLDDKLVGLEHELQLADEAVTEAKIAVGAVTNKKLAIDAVTAEKIAEAAVTAQKLAQEAVTEEKIAGEAITAEKIKAGAIGTAALAAGAVTTDKLDAQAVTAEKIAAGAVTAEKIQAGSITSQHINADGITANLITSGELLTAKVTVASQDGYTKFRGDGITVQDRTGATRIALGRVDELGQQTATFTRNSEAYTSDGQKVGVNQPRFVPGKFGQAVLVEEGTTNLIPSPRWFRDSRGQSSDWCQRTVYSDHHWKVEATGTANNQYEYYYPWVQNVTPDTEYTFSFRVRQCVVGHEIKARVRQGDNQSNLIERHITAADVGKIVSLTFNSGDNTSLTPNIIITVNTGQYTLLEISDIQFEAKPFATSFTDGTRAAETLTIPTEGVLNPQEGTVECWVLINDVIKRADGTPRRIFHVSQGEGTAIGLALYHNINTNEWFLNINGSTAVRVSDELTPNGWNYFAVTYAEGLAKLYINGIPAAIKQGAQLPILGGDLYVGSRNDNTRHCNTLIDDLRISSIARSDEEIIQAYESNQPLPWDEHTTYLMRFDGNLQPVIGHEYGLKMSHGSGEYTKVGDRGLERFVPKPIYSTTPTGVPNTQNFEDGAIPSGWEASGASIDSSVRYAGNYSLRITSGNGKTFARTFQEITKDNTTVSFYYLASGTGPAYTFWVDGQAYALTADGTWRQFTVNVNKGIHMFQWEVYRRYVDSGSGTLNIDNIVFEQSPVEEVLSGYSEEGYTYNYRTYVGTAATVGNYNFPGEWDIPETAIPDVWVQLPQDFVGKDFDVFLSLKNIATPFSDVTIHHASLELLEKDTAKGRFKVRANVAGFRIMYSLMGLMGSYSLIASHTRTVSGVQFTYFATY